MFGIINMFITAFISYQDTYRLYKFLKNKEKREKLLDVVIYTGSLSYVGFKNLSLNLKKKYLH